jgi:phosphate transport system permease protein
MSKKKIVDVVNRSLRKRYIKEAVFKFFGHFSMALGLLFLAVLFFTIVSKGYSALFATEIKLDIEFNKSFFSNGSSVNNKTIKNADYRKMINLALHRALPGVQGKKEKRELHSIVSDNAEYTLRDLVLENPSLISQTKEIWLLADDEVDMLNKGLTKKTSKESDRRITNNQIGWAETLQNVGRLDKNFNSTFFTSGDSREPEQAGILAASVGSLLALIITLFLSFPIGAATAIYLEEFAPKNSKLIDLIEVNINNLAAVPSIIFGLLGLAIFINFFGMPRSVPAVGGLVLTLMTLPTIVITSRAALKSVPPSIKEAALGVGASHMQSIVHHILPLALPGMLTGTIIGMARALGESAPLLMIGMVAFIVDVPKGFFEPSAALPVQIFLWADSPERAFLEKTSAATMILLVFLILMNLMAVILRKRFEKRW